MKKNEMYSLDYNDGRHCREYTPRSLKAVKAKIEQNVKRYFAGTPEIVYHEWDVGKYIEAYAKYPIADDPVGRKIAEISKHEED